MDPDPAGFRVVGSGPDPDPAGTKMSRSGLDPDPAGSENCGSGAPLKKHKPSKTYTVLCRNMARYLNNSTDIISQMYTAAFLFFIF